MTNVMADPMLPPDPPAPAVSTNPQNMGPFSSQGTRATSTSNPPPGNVAPTTQGSTIVSVVPVTNVAPQNQVATIVPDIIETHTIEHSESTEVQNFVLRLTGKGYTPKEVKELVKTTSGVLSQKHKEKVELFQIRSNERNKLLLGGTSACSLVLPLIPGINLMAATAIASVGAVGFAASVYSVFGSKAFEAGRKFRNLFGRKNDDA